MTDTNSSGMNGVGKVENTEGHSLHADAGARCGRRSGRCAAGTLAGRERAGAGQAAGRQGTEAPESTPVSLRAKGVQRGHTPYGLSSW